MTLTYEKLLDELAAGELTVIERKVFDALKKHPEGLRRQQLIAIVFGETVRAWERDNNSADDRKVRKAIESLRSRLVPIISTSGRAGYRLDVSKEARDRMLADLRSRRAKLDALIERTAKFYALPDQYVAPVLARQEQLPL
jgi:hypothetical protein